MKTLIKTSIIFALIFAGHIGAAFCQEVKYENAPKLSPNTTQEMQTPGFWISKITDPDKVILTPSQIAELNTKTYLLPEKIKQLKDINGAAVSLIDVIKYNDLTGVQYRIEDPLSLKSFPGDSLRARLLINRNYLESNVFFDSRGKKIENDFKNRLYDLTDSGPIPDVIRPQYGIITIHAMMRVFPTNEEGFGNPANPGEWYIRGLQTTSCDVASPVAILYKSKDNDWYFVRSETAFGWVQAVNIAIGSPEEIRKYIDSKDFIVAITHKIPVYSDEKCNSFITDLYLGSRIKLDKNTNRGFQVLLPVRKPDGNLEFVSGWVKPDAKVNVGFQKFTQRNMINTLFNLLYQPYGWNDSEQSWHCCGYLRAVARTFGISVGNWPAFELHYSDHTVVFPTDTPREKKYQYLEGCDPGVTLVGHDDHMNVFLGKVNGKLYVIHMGGYDYTTEDGTVMMLRRVNVNGTELKGGYSVDDWTKISQLKP
jgi:hypothetical protein